MDQGKTDSLSREEALAVLNLATDMHWKDEVSGLTPDEKVHFLQTFCNYADDGAGNVTWGALAAAFKKYTERCYFSGSKELQIHNNVGRELKVHSKDNVEQHLTRTAMMSEADYQAYLRKFISIEDTNSRAIPLSGKLTLATNNYKAIDDIPVSPYQTLMFPLKPRKKRSAKRSRSASGFRYA